eukprot:m.134725 g.134725  ORF g.134725 m.134725 type:complete len:94 (+) comp16922_c0_seq1:2260-2541(+)
MCAGLVKKARCPVSRQQQHHSGETAQSLEQPWTQQPQQLVLSKVQPWCTVETCLGWSNTAELKPHAPTGSLSQAALFFANKQAPFMSVVLLTQ